MTPRTASPVLVVGWDLAQDATEPVQRRQPKLLAPVAELARRMGAHVQVVHVLPSQESPDPGVTAQAQRQLHDETSQSGVLQDIAWTAQVLSGPAATTLMAYAEASDAYLLAVGLPRRGLSAAFAHLVSGSVAHDVERLASRPLLLVGTESETGPALTWPSADQPLRVLLGLDQAAAVTPQLLTFAGEFCTRTGASLDVLHVLDALVLPPSNVAVSPVGAGLGPPPQAMARVRQQALERLQHDLAQSPDLAEVPWTAHIAEGPISTKLLNLAADLNAHLIMVGATSDGLPAFLEHLAAGSVTRDLERHADRPVVIVPQADS